ncbi:endonuclease/exonuclease/phosphatase family protein [Cellulomonas alba]|uniref:Endonuclease/exonuclease/phosphatase family protein n=1 Tax=Cellulomonas alba TaxID=3053467 RepID=A0ABT7SBX5_9CELL|nr:endonuclease/exonuclease/phosphatase family protein [Cellulomonas alba]MDM7853691.1 endonuclease/exonuclease/phosphatase family protein [Cellulomonas alba]
MTLERERDVTPSAPVRRAPAHPAWRAAGVVLAALAGAALLVLAVPLAAGVAPVAQLVSFRALVGLGALLAAGVVLGVPWLRRRVLPLGLVLVLGGLAQAAVLAGRTVGQQPGGAASGDGLVVLAFNTADVVDAPTLARLVEQQRADVVALPETSRSTTARTAALLGEAGRPMVVESGASTVPWIQGTTMLVSAALAPGPPTTVSLPVGGVQVAAEGGVLVAGHTTSPTARSQMAAWRADTRALAQTCAAQPGAVVAGDFNATLDHPGLRDLGPCVDAAAAVGRASSGSWPASAPTWLAAPIDHVLVDGRAWWVESFAVLARTGGSDHRPVVAHLVRR